MGYQTDPEKNIGDAPSRRQQLLLEFMLAVILSVAASTAAFSNVATADGSLYHNTIDGLGHMAKISYLAEHYRQMEFPSWCPFWYNGSTMMQYYAPLGYVVMAGIQMVVEDVVLTAKWYCLICLSLGGMGIWASCRRFIGRWCGLFGLVLYCVQPLFAQSFFKLEGGLYAQGIIFLFTPWLLLFVADFVIEPKAKAFLGVAAITALLILGHAMHAFMIGLMIAIVTLPYALTGKIRFQSYIMLGVSMVIGALLCGFWWFVGVTGLETPGTPYLLEEATVFFSADLNWFIPGRSSIFTFSLASLILLVIGFLIYHSTYWWSWAKDRRQFCISWMIYLSIVSTVFSFGQHLAFLKNFPLIATLVPGRILSLTAATTAVVGGFVLHSIIRNYSKYDWKHKGISVALSVLLIGTSLYQMNPYKQIYELADYDANYRTFMPSLAGTGGPFEKGRYGWIAPAASAETYFSTQIYKYNVTEGWNMEGTPHNRTIWSYNVALVSGAEEYIIKDLLFWNVRSVMTLKERIGLQRTLEQYGFSLKMDLSTRTDSAGVLYTSDKPSSYFVKDSRDCLVIGPGAIAMAHEYPFMVHEYETDLMNYQMAELERYKVIYVIEPVLDTVSAVEAFEDRIVQLVDQGVHVLIEPSSLQRFLLFGVGVNNLRLDADSTVLRGTGEQQGEETDIILRAGRQFFSLNGLDEVAYKLYSGEDRAGFDIIGTKQAGQGEVLFIGGRITQYLKSPSYYIWGFQEEDIVPDVDSLKAIITGLIDRGEHSADFMPVDFGVLSSDWDYKGGSFAYSTDEAAEVTVSVTYTPRWKVTLDGKPIRARSRENLVVLDLPAGLHRVRLDYGISTLGYAGYGITAAGLVLLLIGTVFFRRVNDKLKAFAAQIGAWLQLPSPKQSKEDVIRLKLQKKVRS